MSVWGATWPINSTYVKPMFVRWLVFTLDFLLFHIAPFKHIFKWDCINDWQKSESFCNGIVTSKWSDAFHGLFQEYFTAKNFVSCTILVTKEKYIFFQPWNSKVAKPILHSLISSYPNSIADLLNSTKKVLTTAENCTIYVSYFFVNVYKMQWNSPFFT